MQAHHHSRSYAKFAAQILFFAATITALLQARAEPKTVDEAAFPAFYDQFLAAVRASDKTKIADLVAFPVQAWAVESKRRVDEIVVSNKADFLAKYDQLFTPFMRSHALKIKPLKISDDHYAIIWHDTDLEYSFEFEYASSHGFRLTSFLIGPR